MNFLLDEIRPFYGFYETCQDSVPQALIPRAEREILVFLQMTLIRNCADIGLSRHNHPRDGFFLRAESFYNVATNIDDMDELPSLSRKVIESYGGVSLHNQSHGESFLSVVLNRFGGNGLYILDEPEAALSPMRLMSLLAAMNELVKKNSQFIISTHSPIFLSLAGALIYDLDSDGVPTRKWTALENVRKYFEFFEEHRDEFYGAKAHKISDSILHINRGEIFEVEGIRFFAFGGASSHDKEYRSEGKNWWKEELPSNEEIQNAIRKLNGVNYSVDYIITHCAANSIQREIAIMA